LLSVALYHFGESDFDQSAAIQYYDGLRGALVIYDPNDLHVRHFGPISYRHVFEIIGSKVSDTENRLGLDLEHGADGIV
jgi:FtsP/CotA-like multicopper oxidase with cupredoxin domain